MEAWVKRVKHVGNEEETSEGASKDALIALLGQSVSQQTRPCRGE